MSFEPTYLVYSDLLFIGLSFMYVFSLTFAPLTHESAMHKRALHMHPYLLTLNSQICHDLKFSLQYSFYMLSVYACIYTIHSYINSNIVYMPYKCKICLLITNSNIVYMPLLIDMSQPYALTRRYVCLCLVNMNSNIVYMP